MSTLSLLTITSKVGIVGNFSVLGIVAPPTPKKAISLKKELDGIIIDPNDLTVEELVEIIIENLSEQAIFYDGAIDIFETILTSVSKDETIPDYSKVLGDFTKELLIKYILDKLKDVPGGKIFEPIFNLANEIIKEEERAKKAKESHEIVTFFKKYKKTITNFRAGLKPKTYVLKIKEKMKSIDNAQKFQLKFKLIGIFRDIEKNQLKNTDEAILQIMVFWIRNIKITKGGIKPKKIPSDITMRISGTSTTFGHSFKVTHAKINTIGGKKIGEELNSHEKIDVHNMPVHRWLKFFEGNKHATIHMDTKGKHIVDDSVWNRNRADTYYKALKKKDLPPITGKFNKKWP